MKPLESTTPPDDAADMLLLAAALGRLVGRHLALRGPSAEGAGDDSTTGMATATVPWRSDVRPRRDRRKDGF